jgi:flagellar secretion chaperone FliS
MNNPYANYKQQSIATMTPGEMINALYEGLIKNLNLAMIAIDNKDFSAAHSQMMKGQDILNYLISTLNLEIAISHEILNIYEFILRTMIEANLSKSKEKIEAVLPLLQELKVTFAQADKIARMQR